MRVRRLAAATCLAATVLAPGPATGTAAAATCDGRAATIVGTDRDDELTGTPGDDVIAGLGGQDTIDGGGGNDVLCGDAGADVVTGGPGSDRMFGGDNGLVPRFEAAPEPSGDTLVPGPGDDLVDLGANTFVAGGYNSGDTLDLTDAAAGVTLDLVAGTAVGEGTDVVVVPAPAAAEGPAVEVLGSVHADRILGTEWNDHLVGQGGGDWIEGRGGDDLVMNAWDEYSPARGENADDHFDGGPGADFVDSTGGTDVLLGGDGADDMRKAGGPATVDGGPGRDEIDVYLTGGRHTVTGGTGRDHVALAVIGSFGRTRGVMDHRREVFRVRHAHGRRTRAVVASVEEITMPHNAGRWTYLGTRGDDRVGGGAAYTARGRAGDDVLIGSAWDDVLLGGGGRDRVVGGRGVDRCRGEELVGCELRGAS
nr:calcium-binding protein [uncultured Nocardioides sp.]